MRFAGLEMVVSSTLALAAFAHIVITLFSKDIPDVMVSFFKGAEEIVMVGFIFIFVLAWMRKAKPKKRVGSYVIAVFDVFGKNTHIDGIRTTFSTNDVATSFARSYKQMYPLHNFAVLTDIKEKRRTIIRYV